MRRAGRAGWFLASLSSQDFSSRHWPFYTVDVLCTDQYNAMHFGDTFVLSILTGVLGEVDHNQVDDVSDCLINLWKQRCIVMYSRMRMDNGRFSVDLRSGETVNRTFAGYCIIMT